MKHVMLDLETLGTSEDAPVVEIGAVTFDLDKGLTIDSDNFHQLIDLESYDNSSLYFKPDMSTINWWLNQPKEAQNRVFGGTYRSGFEPAFRALNTFLKDCDTLWCHAPFDYKIIEATFKKMGIRCNVPFYKVCDLRTAVKLAEYDYKKHPFNGVKHSALDDCHYQISYLLECRKRTKGDR